MIALVSLMSKPAIAADYKVLSATELKNILDSGKKYMLLNPLSDIEFNQGHIPGSVNIPLHSLMNSDKLPRDKGTLIITYCLGVK